MTTRDELQALHGELWALRDELEPHWPTPNALDSLRFAVTECGEAMDAYLRTKGGYSRNHAKEPDIYGELADTALMLFSALGREHQYATRQPAYERKDIGGMLDWLSYDVASALCDCSDNPRLPWQNAVADCLATIPSVPGMDFAAELRKRMAKWRDKWGAPEDSATRRDKAEALTKGQ